jgi:hypothetical protein
MREHYDGEGSFDLGAPSWNNASTARYSRKGSGVCGGNVDIFVLPGAERKDADPGMHEGVGRRQTCGYACTTERRAKSGAGVESAMRGDVDNGAIESGA